MGPPVRRPCTPAAAPSPSVRMGPPVRCPCTRAAAPSPFLRAAVALRNRCQVPAFGPRLFFISFAPSLQLNPQKCTFPAHSLGGLGDDMELTMWWLGLRAPAISLSAQNRG